MDLENSTTKAPDSGTKDIGEHETGPQMTRGGICENLHNA